MLRFRTMWPRVDEQSFEETRESRRMAAAPDIVTSTLEDLAAAPNELGAHGALLGGQALIAHGVPRDTLDADALVAEAALGDLANELVERFGWKPLDYDPGAEDYVEAAEPTAHFMQDPVLFDPATERVLF